MEQLAILSSMNKQYQDSIVDWLVDSVRYNAKEYRRYVKMFGPQDGLTKWVKGSRDHAILTLRYVVSCGSKNNL